MIFIINLKYYNAYKKVIVCNVLLLCVGREPAQYLAEYDIFIDVNQHLVETQKIRGSNVWVGLGHWWQIQQ
jgi:hypothetical protein